MIRIKRLKSSSDLLIWTDFENIFLKKTGYKILLKPYNPIILDNLFYFSIILTKLTFIIFLASLINFYEYKLTFIVFFLSFLFMIFIVFLTDKIENEKHCFYSPRGLNDKYWIDHDLFLNFIKIQSKNLINNLKTTNENQEDFINKLTKPVEKELFFMKENLILFSKHFHNDFYQIFGHVEETKLNNLLKIKNNEDFVYFLTLLNIIKIIKESDLMKKTLEKQKEKEIISKLRQQKFDLDNKIYNSNNFYENYFNK